MAIAKKSNASKALQSHMASEKRFSSQANLEWEMACNTNPKRGHVWDQSEINALYDRDCGDGAGATKICHTTCHTGVDFRYIVVKRHQTDGYIDEHQWNPTPDHTGNQLVDEIICWEKYAGTEYSDYLCPILKYFKSKSDKVAPTSETMQKNVVIVAQKAQDISNLMGACSRAAELNHEDEETARARYVEMVDFATDQGWRDAVHNRGNSGVIYDYSKQKFKAVFVDYAL